MPLRVIGAGLGRTGTMSLKLALEELGFAKCYHMVELLQNPEQVVFWEAASDGSLLDWDLLFDGYQAAVDYPACRYYRELMSRYPEGKVILTVRDSQSWYESASATIFQVAKVRQGGPGAPPQVPFPGDPALFGRIFGMVNRDVWHGDFAGRLEDRDHTMATFQRHNEAVKDYVPAERLLVYEVKQGWEPLCRFLGVPVPKGKEFPRANDRETFQARLQHRAGEPG